MPRKKKAQEPTPERGTPEQLPQQLEGQFRCPGCTRVFEIKNKVDLDTAKLHIRNRAHGHADQLVRVDARASAPEPPVTGAGSESGGAEGDKTGENAGGNDAGAEQNQNKPPAETRATA